MLNLRNHKPYSTHFLAYLTIILLTTFTYFRSLHNEFILVDDSDQILNHPQIQSIKFIPQHFINSTYYRSESNQSYGLFYRPLMLSIYTVLYSTFGPNPFIFHLTQLIFHVITSCLIFAFFNQLITSSLRFNKLNAGFQPKPYQIQLSSLLATLIFSIHPINSETLLHAANLQDVLFVFFGLISLHLIVLRKTHYAFSTNSIFLLTSTMLLSLMGKETAMLFIALINLYALIFHVQLIKFTIFSSLISVFVYIYFRFHLAQVSFGFDSIAKITHAPLWMRLFHIPQVIMTYLQTYIFPRELIVFQYWFYDQPNINIIIWPILILLSLIIFVSIIVHKLYQSKSAYFKIVTFFIIWILIGFLAHIHIIPLSQTVAERWFYFTSIGFSGLIAIGLCWLMSYQASLSTSRFKIAYIISLISLVAVLCYRTYQRTLDWSDSVTLFKHDLELQKDDNYFIQNSLASAYLNESNYALAKPLIIDSVNQYPYFGNLNNLALIYTFEDNRDAAQTAFESALKLDGNYTAYQNYANILYFKWSHIQKAREISQHALTYYPYASHLWTIVALSEKQLGNYSEATQAAQLAYQYQAEPYTLAVLRHVTQDEAFHPSFYFKLEL